MVWHDPDDDLCEVIDATWEEFSQFERENFRFLTFSEYDSPEHASIFSIEQDVPPYAEIERDFYPVNFIASLYFQTRKGKRNVFWWRLEKRCTNQRVFWEFKFKLWDFLQHYWESNLRRKKSLRKYPALLNIFRNTFNLLSISPLEVFSTGDNFHEFFFNLI